MMLIQKTEDFSKFTVTEKMDGSVSLLSEHCIEGMLKSRRKSRSTALILSVLALPWVRPKSWLDENPNKARHCFDASEYVEFEALNV